MKQFKGTLLNFLIITASVLFLIPALSADTFAVDTCIDCHKDKKFRIQDKKLFNYYNKWKGSIHDVAGLSCRDCHGGDSTRAKKEHAHPKNLSPGNINSMVFYKNIPKTCGKCHENVYTNFIRSKHYKALEKAGKGPNCATCHGSLVTNVYYASIVSKTCTSCHNQQTKNHPEIIKTAEQILQRLNVSRGYLKWASRHFKDSDKVELLKNINNLYQNISDSWHRFNFTNTDENSRELLSELRTIFNETYNKEKKKKE